VDYIREAEKYLSNYKRLEKAIENLSFELSKTNMMRTSNNITQQFEPTGIKSSRNDMDAEMQLLQWTQLKAMQTETQEELNNIDYNLKYISLDSGCEFYGKLLRMWYIDKTDIMAISQEVGYSKRQLYEHKAKAIKALSIQLFGKRALVAI
jgi:hypothetical protein